MAPTRHRPAGETGFTLVELLVVVLVLGLIAAVAVPALVGQQRAALDQAVTSDLAKYRAAAERAYSANFAYPVTVAGFDLRDAGAPDAQAGNGYQAFVVSTGPHAGYVVYGRNATTGNLQVLSSWAGTDPLELGARELPDAPPAAGQHGVPAEVTASMWAHLEGLAWGEHTRPPVDASPVAPMRDPTFTDLTKSTRSNAPEGNVQPYGAWSQWRVVDLPSPVASRAVEVVAEDDGNRHGVWFAPYAPAASWPEGTPVVENATDPWTVSVWVKGQGVPLNRVAISARFIRPTLGYVGGSPTCVATLTDQWQRVTCTITPDPAHVGAHVGVHVLDVPPYAQGRTFWVTAPQVNRGPHATPFMRQD